MSSTARSTSAASIGTEARVNGRRPIGPTDAATSSSGGSCPHDRAARRARRPCVWKVEKVGGSTNAPGRIAVPSFLLLEPLQGNPPDRVRAWDRRIHSAVDSRGPSPDRCSTGRRRWCCARRPRRHRPWRCRCSRTNSRNPRPAPSRASAPARCGGRETNRCPGSRENSPRISGRPRTRHGARRARRNASRTARCPSAVCAGASHRASGTDRTSGNTASACGGARAPS